MTDSPLTLDLGELAVDEFAEFWAAYPRHRDRHRAEAAYRRARRVASHAEILTGARTFADRVRGEPVELVQIATSWLSTAGWKPPAPPRRPEAMKPTKSLGRRPRARNEGRFR